VVPAGRRFCGCSGGYEDGPCCEDSLCKSGQHACVCKVCGTPGRHAKQTAPAGRGVPCVWRFLVP
jgi:hypothetical protein